MIFDKTCLITVLIITPDDLGDNSAATNSLGTLKIYQYLVLQPAVPGGVFKVNLAPGTAQGRMPEAPIAATLKIMHTHTIQVN